LAAAARLAPSTTACAASDRRPGSLDSGANPPPPPPPAALIPRPSRRIRPPGVVEPRYPAPGKSSSAHWFPPIRARNWRFASLDGEEILRLLPLRVASSGFACRDDGRHILGLRFTRLPRGIIGAICGDQLRELQAWSQTTGRRHFSPPRRGLGPNPPPESSGPSPATAGYPASPNKAARHLSGMLGCPLLQFPLGLSTSESRWASRCGDEFIDLAPGQAGPREKTRVVVFHVRVWNRISIARACGYLGEGWSSLPFGPRLQLLARDRAGLRRRHARRRRRARGGRRRRRLAKTSSRAGRGTRWRPSSASFGPFARAACSSKSERNEARDEHRGENHERGTARIGREVGS